MRYLVYLFFMLSTWGAAAQLSFYRQYSGTEYDFGQGVVQLPDSSYAIRTIGASITGGQNSMKEEGFYPFPIKDIILREVLYPIRWQRTTCISLKRI
ncbi:MAG: hypothetical protein EBV23_10955 [Flavobacteriia bacterium]|nr:hypothetical protein [Flavobacteriia bacterium]